MATLFMRIDKNDKIKGGATVEKIGGKEGWFALQSVSGRSPRRQYRNLTHQAEFRNRSYG